MSAATFRRWRKWLKRIEEEQFENLLINQNIFRKVQAAWQRQGNVHLAGDLAHWMAENYAAFAATAIRRIVDSRQDVVSLMVLLKDVEANSHLLTFKRLRGKYRNVKQHAEYDWNKHVGIKHVAVPKSQVTRDIRRILKATKKIRRLVNKSIAHNEADRRRRGIQRFRDLNEAIATLHTVFSRYHLLILARQPADVGDVFSDVEEDVAKIWP